MCGSPNTVGPGTRLRHLVTSVGADDGNGLYLTDYKVCKSAAFPCTHGEMGDLERVHNLVTRMIPGPRDKLHIERSAVTEIFTLDYRRVRILCMRLYPELEHLFKLS